MAKHYPAKSKSKDVLQDQFVSGTISAMIGKGILTLTFPRSVADHLNIERGANLNYQIIGKKLVISIKENNED